MTEIEEIKKYISKHLFYSAEDLIGELCDEFDIKKEDVKIEVINGNTGFIIRFPQFVINTHIEVSDDICY